MNSHRFQPVIICTVVLVYTAMLLSCSGHQPLGQTGLCSTAGDFTLSVWPESFLGAKPSGTFSIDVADEPYGAVAVTVHAKSVQQLKAFYSELSFDPARYAFVESAVEQGLGPADDLLSLTKLAAPGTVHFGEVLILSDSKPGLSGDGVLAKLRFKPVEAPAPGGLLKSMSPLNRSISRAVDLDSSRAPCTYDPNLKYVEWFYTNRGDYDQNGLVVLSDLTPLAAHFLQHGPFGYGSIGGVVDGDGNGLINLADITPIAASYGCDATGGYEVYASLNPADYPDSNLQATKIASYSHRDLTACFGTPSKERRAYIRDVSAAPAGSYFWVRPVDAHGALGSPSALAGTAAALPVLSIAPFTGDGDGTLDYPYIVKPSLDYKLHVEQQGFGDLTSDSGTKYFAYPGTAATVTVADGILHLPTPATEDFWIIATTHNGTSGSCPIFVDIGLSMTWTDTLVDAGTPNTHIVGGFSSASNVGGKPAVAYYDGTSANLKYAELDGSWEIQTVDAPGDVGANCSLYGDSYSVKISYRDETAGRLKLAYAPNTDPAPADWQLSYVTAAGNNTGRRSSVAVMASKVAIAYSDNTLGGLAYARATVSPPTSPADWVTYLIDPCGNNCDVDLAMIGGLPAIAYRDMNNNHLKYARALVSEPSNAGDWVVMTADGMGDVGYRPSLTFTGASFDQPMITYYSADNSGLLGGVGTTNPSSSADWDAKWIDGAGSINVGIYSSVDGGVGTLWVAYYDATHGRLRFALSDSLDPLTCDWNCDYVGNATDAGAYCSLSSTFVNTELVPVISYMDVTSGDLRVAIGSF